MHKVVVDSSFKSVETTSTISGIKSAVTHTENNFIISRWLQIRVCALFVRCLWTGASTTISDYLTSIGGYLYSSSTAPIVITTNFNKLIIVRSV